MAAYKLRITFEGLCVYVTNEEVTAMMVFITDARNPGISSRKKRLLPHLPSVKFNLEDLAGATEQEKLVNFEYVTNIDNQRQASVSLDKDDISFEPVGGNLLTNTLDIKPLFYALIPHMKNLYPGVGKNVHESCFGAALDNDLVGRMKFTGGTVNVIDLLQNQFQWDGAGHRQSCARIVTIDQEFDTDTVNVNFRDRKVQLKLKEDKAAVITIRNAPPYYYDPATEFEYDFDFELIYKIMDGYLSSDYMCLPKKLPIATNTTDSMACAQGQANNSQLVKNP